MSGTGMQSHNAEIANGTYTPNIGSTTLHAFCNANEGFAIYAAGYTGNEVGGTNSNKLVGTTASSNATIESGIATTAGNPDISNWAMKLTMTQDSGDTSTDNAFTIDSAPNEALPSQAESGATQAPFSNYHAVPNEYVKVAHKNSGTDMTDTTGGVKLTTTYAAYISKTQPADTYSGQVIYTLVHPAAINPNYLSIVYDGNGLYFDNNPSKTTNTVQYDATREISSDPVTKVSRSIYNEDGTYGGYGDKGGNNVVSINGAEKLHITVTYGVPANNGGPPSELYIWSGSHPTYTNANNNTSLTSCGTTNAVDGAFKSDGQPNSQVTMECDIDSDSVTFYDDSQHTVSTGYYATITSIGDIVTYPKTVAYGTYTTPSDIDENRFLGWSEDANATYASYKSIEEITTKAQYLNRDGTITLFAIWIPEIQNLSPSKCVSSIRQVIDNRDDKLYNVSRLADGNCWLLDNLALDPTDQTVREKLQE